MITFPYVDNNIISNLADMTQEEFDTCTYFSFLTREEREKEAIFWQESAANWHFYMTQRREDAGLYGRHDKINNCAQSSAEAHKLSRLYMGTWE